MRYLVASLCVFTLLGCSGEVEQRRVHTLERMQHQGGTAETKRVQQLILASLEQADVSSLQSPSLVNVTVRVVPDHTKRGTLGVNWISSLPVADGIRVRFGDGSQIDIAFDEVEIEHNEEEASTIVLFSASPFLEREYPGAWKKLLADPEAKVVLINGGGVVSNE